MALNLSSSVSCGESTHGSFDVTFRSYLASAKDVFPHVNQIDAPKTAPFQGTPADFLVAQGEEKVKFQHQMNNKVNLTPLSVLTVFKVRVCPNAACKKPVAFTLPNCNGCGQDITKVEITFSTNIFTSFIYGIEKGKLLLVFPFHLFLEVLFLSLFQSVTLMRKR